MRPKIGIVGLPNVGKSTFLNLMAEKNIALEAPWPFSTIDPNRGIVFYDKNIFFQVAQTFNSKKITFAEFELIDVAGLVKNAHQGKGLGNEFLSHLKEADIIIEIIRTFEKDDIPHLHGSLNPQEDHQIIVDELNLADIKICDRHQKNDPRLSKIKEKIQNNLPPSSEDQWAKKYGLFWLKPKIIIENGCLNLPWVDFSFSFKEQFSKQIKIKILEKIMEKLNLTYFVTANENETKIHLIFKEATFLEAASLVHSEFAQKLIKVNVSLLEPPFNQSQIFNKNDKVFPQAIYFFILTK